MLEERRFSICLKRYLDDNKVSVNAFAAEIGASPASVYNWLAGNTKPLPVYFDKIVALLSRYDISPINEN